MRMEIRALATIRRATFACCLCFALAIAPAAAEYYSVDIRSIPVDALDTVDQTKTPSLTDALTNAVRAVPKMVPTSDAKVPGLPDYMLSSTLTKAGGAFTMTLFSIRTSDHVTQVGSVTGADFATLSANIGKLPLQTLLSLGPAFNDASSLVVPLHAIDDKSPNITNRLVAALAEKGYRAKPKLDINLQDKSNTTDLTGVCAQQGVQTVFGWDVEEERTSDPLGIYTYRAEVAIHQFGCTTGSTVLPVIGHAKKKLWLNMAGGVSALVALATLGGANPALSPVSTFVSSTTSRIPE